MDFLKDIEEKLTEIQNELESEASEDFKNVIRYLLEQYFIPPEIEKHIKLNLKFATNDECLKWFGETLSFNPLDNHPQKQIQKLFKTLKNPSN